MRVWASSLHGPARVRRVSGTRQQHARARKDPVWKKGVQIWGLESGACFFWAAFIGVSAMSPAAADLKKTLQEHFFFVQTLT